MYVISNSIVTDLWYFKSIHYGNIIKNNWYTTYFHDFWEGYAHMVTRMYRQGRPPLKKNIMLNLSRMLINNCLNQYFYVRRRCFSQFLENVVYAWKLYYLYNIVVGIVIHFMLRVLVHVSFTWHSNYNHPLKTSQKYLILAYWLK